MNVGPLMELREGVAEKALELEGRVEQLMQPAVERTAMALEGLQQWVTSRLTAPRQRG